MRPHFGGVARINTALRPSWETIFNIFLETYMRPVAHTLIFNLFIFQVLTPQYLFLVTKVVYDCTFLKDLLYILSYVHEVQGAGYVHTHAGAGGSQRG